MPRLFLAVMLGLNAIGAIAADDTTASKRAEILKLLHYTKQTGGFMEAVKETVAIMQKENPSYPARYWEDLTRGVRIDAYSQWVSGLFDAGLTEADLKQLNAIYSDPVMKKLLDELLVSLAGKSGADFVRGVQEFRQSHDPKAADDLIRFMQSSTAQNYRAVLGQISTGQHKIMEQLLRESHERMQARRK